MSHFRVFRFPRARFSRVDFWQNWYVLQQKMIKKSNNPEVLTSNTWATKKRNCINKTLTALAVIINRTLRLLTFFTSLSSLIHPHFLNGNYSTCDVIVEFWLLRIGQQIDATKSVKVRQWKSTFRFFFKSKPNSPNYWHCEARAKSKWVIPFTCRAFKLILKGLNWLFNIKLSFFASHMKCIWMRLLGRFSNKICRRNMEAWF